ncbi:ABC transporter substrate-binding protein [Microcella humidisoli]|uniref:ABC transporter substrate-binding protein n=1 Tax=Microcella humidisoli TaxID=2963406 RepID=A0ABY5FZB3_9MICO|nr:ABC transporter substrate-binding protein [Microcella humidisoli]UTT63613.1 ABC transporter substrate-binding protein [Microcella humidisoli]
MTTLLSPKRALALGLSALVLGLAGCATTAEDAPSEAKLTLLVGSAETELAIASALVAGFTATRPDVEITLETRPAGADGDNLVKTKLATGEMNDLLFYNAGASANEALSVDTYMLDLSGEGLMENVNETFRQGIRTTDGSEYAVPIGGATGGGLFYNKKVYADLGLAVPTTWAEFEKNNSAILAAGIVPVAQTYGETWTSQMLFAANFANVLSEEPDWAERFTNNEAKFADDPIARRGMDYIQQGFDEGWFNSDAATATFEDGLRMVATGEAATYPMLTFAGATIEANYPDNIADIGFFAVPAKSADDTRLTAWLPGGMYVSKDTEHPQAALDFAAYVASTQGCDVITEAVGVTGPYLIEGCSLPTEVSAYISDLLGYLDTEGASAPPLEFLSPVKGPNLEQILVAVGTGQIDSASAAMQYDEDVEKQAQQLGLAGW